MNKVQDIYSAEEELKMLYVNGILTWRQAEAIREHAKRFIALESGPEFAFYEDAVGDINKVCKVSTPSQKYYIEYISQKLVKLRADNQPPYTAGI